MGQSCKKRPGGACDRDFGHDGAAGRRGRACGAPLYGQGALTAVRPREIGSACAPRIIMRSDGRGAYSNLKRFKMLRNASECSALRFGRSTIHQATATTVATPQRPHGDTQGPRECRSRPVRAIRRANVVAPIALQDSANPCKRLQSASICFETAMHENAIICTEMLRNVSF